MKKLFLFFGLLMMSLAPMYGQNNQDAPTPWSQHPLLSNYTLYYRAIDATCYNNGQVEFYIGDANGNPIDQATFESLRLADFAFAYRGVVLDTTLQHKPFQYTVPKTRIQMETGSFEIYLQCNRQESDGNWVAIVDTTEQTIELNYTVPVISPLTVRSSDGVMLGNLPTLDCTPTGRVQVSVTGGRFPYHFVVVNHNDSEDTLRTVQVDTNQSFGTIDTLANYRNYYTFDEMPSGEWDIYLVDGCGYEMPRASVLVDEIAPPKLDSIGVYASSGNISDNNTLKIKVYLGNDIRYYLQLFKPYMTYRFLVPAQGGDTVELAGSTTEWVSFPSTNTGEVTVSMDILHTNTYCNLLDRDLIFQLKLDQNPLCTPYILSDTFHYYRPKENKFIKENGWTVISQSDPGDCGGLNILRHQDHFSIRYAENKPNNVNPNDDHDYLRYHFTYPIRWEYRDGAGNVLKRDTIASNIANKSYIDLADLGVDTTHYPISTGYYMYLFDANGCELFKQYRTIVISESSSGGTSARWSKRQESTQCCKDGNAPRSITIYEEFGSENLSYDGLTVELVNSPDHVYDFTAVYHAATHSWAVNKDHGMENLATINGATDGKTISMTEQCLPSGNYQFQISNIPCITGAVPVNVLLPGYVSARVEVEPGYEIVDNCSNKFIKFTTGKIMRDSIYRNANNQVVTKSVELPIRFRLVDGPVGGFDRNDKTYYTIGDSILISIPTDTRPYVLEITVDDSKRHLCEPFVRYDTIYYNGSTVMFDFALGFLCQVGDTIGTAYVRAWNGNPPYTYQLYSEADLGGTLIGETTLNANEVATFPNRIMHANRQLSCRVEDRCGAAFKLNFFPQTMAEIQKTWFDGGLTAITTCEGSTIQVHVLRVGDIFQYAWYKDDATEPFTTTSEPGLFIPRHADTAVYHVRIFSTGCSEFIEDSVTIYPKKSPYLEISAVDSVCPGEDVVVSFKPHAEWGDEVSFSVVFQTRDETIIVDHESVLSGSTVTDTFTVNSPAKVYPYVVRDAECGYPVADPGDTIYIDVKKKIINPCLIVTVNDTVCYGEDARLEASCTEPAPLTIRWYSDFEMKDLLDTYEVTTTGDVSYHPLDELRERTIRYVSVYKEGFCPSVNNNPNNVVNMTADAVTELRCTDSYLFFDEGGPNGDYPVDANHTKHVFVNTESDKPLTIHFDSLNLSSTAHLFLFSSALPVQNHLICELTSYTTVPDIIVSPNDTLMAYFVPGDLSEWGWRATVQPSPGIAIADVMRPEVTPYYDRVCQRSSDTLYDNQEIIDLGIASQETLALARTKAGTYLYTRHDNTSFGCDSVSTLTFMVSSPKMHEIVGVTTSEIGYTWHNHVYYEAGIYAYNIPDEHGCDFLDVLNLIVIEVTNDNGDVCYGESTVIGLNLVTNDTVKPKSSLIEEHHIIGDVLCKRDNMYKVMRPDDYLTSGKDSGWVAYGVVSFVDPNDNSHGKAIALVDAKDDNKVIWAKENWSSVIHSVEMKDNYLAQRTDMDGAENTRQIRQSVDPFSVETFKEAAPAAYYCYYYDPEIKGTGGAHSGWYLPSCGEWYNCFAYRTVINQTLNKLADFGAHPLIGGPDDNYWTSTEISNSNASLVNGKGQLIQHYSKSDAKPSRLKRVRAMIAY